MKLNDKNFPDLISVTLIVLQNIFLRRSTNRGSLTALWFFHYLHQRQLSFREFEKNLKLSTIGYYKSENVKLLNNMILSISPFHTFFKISALCGNVVHNGMWVSWFGQLVTKQSQYLKQSVKGWYTNILAKCLNNIS